MIGDRRAIGRTAVMPLFAWDVDISGLAED
jgi:hypothetical protein